MIKENEMLEELKKNSVVLVFVLFLLTLVLVVNNKVMTAKVTNNVLDSLKRDYVPGPYDPGFDPDKVPPRR